MENDKYWESKVEAIEIETRLTLNEYLLSLKLENKAAQTIINYRRVLEKFLAFYSKGLEELTSDEFLDWLND